MANVLIEPLGVTIEVEAGESLMEAAERAGLTWPTLCGGVAMCTMCWVRVVDGDVGAMDRHERDALETGRWGDRGPEPDVRLACQFHVRGDAVVFKRGVGQAGRAGVYR